ncbi:hypothetical protein CsNV_091 [Callinectes sapidus nudivirus]|nr:hypothetical protein CsNV_091 [Callinectes sapidus nudivirus]
MENNIVVIVLNVNCAKQINANSKIDYVSIFPNFILFGSKFSYTLDNKNYTVEPNHENTIHVSNVQTGPITIFEKLHSKKTQTFFIKFDERFVSIPDMSQMVENISEFLKKK